MVNSLGLHRRSFLKFLAISVGGLVLSRGFWTKALADISSLRIQRAIDPDHLTDFERQHVPQLFMLEAAEDGARVPVTVFVENPMTPDHYITSIEILNYNDPIISKGVFYLTPENGRAYLSTQVRLDSGESTVYAVSTCNRHGRWVGSQKIFVNRGGC